MSGKTYREKLRDPRWQRKRLEIMARDKFTCQKCGDGRTTLNVHHKWYFGAPWDVPDDWLITLCEPCHAKEPKPTAPPDDFVIIEDVR